MLNHDDFASLTVSDMRGICRNKGFNGYSRLNRAELIAFLINALATPDVGTGDVVSWNMRDEYNTTVYGMVVFTSNSTAMVRVPGWSYDVNLLAYEYTKVTGEVADDTMSRVVECDFRNAQEENAMIDEAYAGKAEDANMSIPAYRACLKSHKRNGEIFLSGLWNTPIAHMHKVVTFADGSRYGVSNGDASFFTGEVSDMPDGEISKCVHCKSVLLTEKTEEIVSDEIDEYAPAKRIERINSAITFLTPMRDEAERAFIAARDGDNVADEVIDTAYQVFADFDRSISEYRRTLAYLADMVS